MNHHWTASRALIINQTAERFKDFFVSIGTSVKSYLPAKPLSKNGAFPEVLKLAKVIPKNKGDSKTDKNNYRQISLLPV